MHKTWWAILNAIIIFVNACEKKLCIHNPMFYYIFIAAQSPTQWWGITAHMQPGVYGDSEHFHKYKRGPVNCLSTALLEPGWWSAHSKMQCTQELQVWIKAQLINKQVNLWSSEAARIVKFNLIWKHLWTFCLPGLIKYYKE